MTLDIKQANTLRKRVTFLLQGLELRLGVRTQRLASLELLKLLGQLRLLFLDLAESISGLRGLDGLRDARVISSRGILGSWSLLLRSEHLLDIHLRPTELGVRVRLWRR